MGQIERNMQLRYGQNIKKKLFATLFTFFSLVAKWLVLNLSLSHRFTSNTLQATLLFRGVLSLQLNFSG